jgi:hypothetical protein
MSIASELEFLAGTKAAIRSAIMAKGVTVPAGTPFRQYATLISGIEGGEVGLSGTSLIVNWTDASADEDGFRVELSKASDFDPLEKTVTVAANTESTTVIGLDYNTLYYVRVYAFNEVGDSSALSGSATTLPDVPVNLVVVHGGGTGVDLTWDAPVGPATGAVSYKVEYKLSSEPTTWTTAAAAEPGTSYSIAGLTGDTSYDFRVSGNNAGGTGAASEIATVTTAEGIGDPTEISDLLLWYDETGYRNSVNAYPSNGQGANTWLDNSGSGKNLTGFGNQVYNSAENAVYYDGAGDGHRNTAGFTPPDHYPWTVFVVAKPTRENVTQTYFALWQNGNNTNGIMLIEDSSNQIQSTSNFLGTSSTGLNTTSAIVVNTKNVFTGFFGSNYRMARLNGVDGTVNTTSGTTNGLLNYIGLGHQPAYGNINYLQGYVYEVVVYSRLLTASEISQVENHLAAKWGVTL